MGNQTSQPFLPTQGKFCKEKVYVFNVASVKSNKRKTIVTDKNNIKHNCPYSISKIERLYKKDGLIIVRKGEMVNLNYASKKDRFNIKIFKLINGALYNVSRRILSKIKKPVKKYKVKKWRDLIGLY